MAWRALGDSAWLFSAIDPDPASRLGRVLALRKQLEIRRIPEVSDLVCSFETLAVHFDPADAPGILRWIQSQPLPECADLQPCGPLTRVPVLYGGADGPDLEALAAALGMSPGEVVRLHSGADYRVAAVGFSPGFPFLIGLPPALHVPRLDSPRKVAAGSVAIAGGQAGIYPSASQGGWHVIGRTSFPLFDPHAESPCRLKPGDHIQFEVSDGLGMMMEAVDVNNRLKQSAFLEVMDSGALTTIQDLGRPGYQGLGVSPGGALDAVAMRVVNRLLGNPEGAAVLECTLTGPVLVARERCRLAWHGWSHPQEGRPVELLPGDCVDLRRGLRSVRGYVGVAGGIDVPRVLGSRATDVRAGWGGMDGRALRAGDVLGIGPVPSGPRAGAWRVGWPQRIQARGMIEIRVLPGVQAAWFTPQAREALLGSAYRVSPVSDRTGTRLEGPALERDEDHRRDLVSQPVVAGSIQVPPDGRPIVLMAERQTIGGYPQIAHVISADLPMLARAWPGTDLRFREVTHDEAREAWLELRGELGLLRSGLDFLR